MSGYLPGDATLIAAVKQGVIHLQEYEWWHNEKALLRILWLMASGQVEGCNSYGVEYQVKQIRTRNEAMQKAREAVA